MRHLTSAMLIVAGLVHLPPLIGVLGAERLTTLYGISFSEPNLVILMRHRAVLFGLLGVFMIIAAFEPSLHLAAFVGGFVALASFLWLAWSVGGYNAAIRRLVIVDAVAFVCLLVGIAAHVVA